MTDISVRISDINRRAIDFWRDAGSKMWFAKSDQFDADIDKKFGQDVIFLENIDLVKYFEDEQDGNQMLGIIICIDQFRRNLFRNNKKTFEQDFKALGLAKYMVSNQLVLKIEQSLQMFAHMPYMHSENLEDQEMALKLFDNSEFAVIHYDIIKQFNRFPHRNKMSGRTSSAEELAFLQAGGFHG